MITPEMLLATRDIVNYPSLFPRLRSHHPQYLGDPSRTPPSELAALLTIAGREGPVTSAEAADRYRRNGELDSLLAIAPDQVTPAAAEWQRLTEDKLTDAERRARLCDRERVPTSDGRTWQHLVDELRQLLTGKLAGSPGVILHHVEQCQEQMHTALAAQKMQLRNQLRTRRDELAASKAALDDAAYERAVKLSERINEHIDADDLFLAVQRLEELAGIIQSQTATFGERTNRLPLPNRVNPFPKNSFHFEDVLTALRSGTKAIKERGLQRFFPDQNAITQALDAKEFLEQHATRRTPTSESHKDYFSAFERWLGLGQRKQGKVTRLNMTNMEPRGRLHGRWYFMQTEAWRGVPFYEDTNGQPRIVAVIRLAIAYEDRANWRIVTEYIAQTLKELFAGEAVSADEVRFRQEGLVLVLVPGNMLSSRPYIQFHRAVRLDRGVREERIAYIDDLDLLRLLPVNSEERFRALLELALPRFPAAVSVTYQNSDAVRPRMFYGRRDEILALENGTTVVFSGRRMGKSSLLRRLQSQCSSETAQRAILVGCSAISVGRSWQILKEIERELAALVRREQGSQNLVATSFNTAPTEDAVADMERAKSRFREYLSHVMTFVESVGIRQIFVLLDEADNFVRAEMEENSGRRRESPRERVSWFLKDLQTIDYAGRLRFIFAGYDQLGRIFRDPGLGESAFGNWGSVQPLNLGPLDPASARSLVIEPLTALGMPVEEDIATRILDYTSGHASLIQLFGRRLAEHIRDKEPEWPLNDIPVKFEHLIKIADDERGEGNFRQLLEQTLGLNLDIARAYPLRYVFLALVTPAGIGNGKILGAEEFSTATAMRQLQSESPEQWPELTDTLVADCLELLVQLGLLEEPQTDLSHDGRKYRFRAWHYVTVLRTRNGLRTELRKAADDWMLGTRRLSAEPRCVWTMPDHDLHALRRLPPLGASVLVGLPKSGRDYAIDMLSSQLADGSQVLRLSPVQSDFAEQLTAWLSNDSGQLALVADPDDIIAWDDVRRWLRGAIDRERPLRWVGGARLAWDLTSDYELLVDLHAVHGLGPLTVAEMEPWTARPLGTESTSSGAIVQTPEAEKILLHTGAILPVLELFRDWLHHKKGGMPDPLTARVAQEYLQQLKNNPAMLERAAQSVATGIPLEFREGLHHLFLGTAEYGSVSETAADLREASPYLQERGPEFVNRVLDTARWLGFATATEADGRWRIPHASALGLIVQHPRFIAQP